MFTDILICLTNRGLNESTSDPGVGLKSLPYLKKRLGKGLVKNYMLGKLLILT